MKINQKKKEGSIRCVKYLKKGDKTDRPPEGNVHCSYTGTQQDMAAFDTDVQTSSKTPSPCP